jgi:hypothetical protein
MTDRRVLTASSPYGCVHRGPGVALLLASRSSRLVIIYLLFENLTRFHSTEWSWSACNSTRSRRGSATENIELNEGHALTWPELPASFARVILRVLIGLTENTSPKAVSAFHDSCG